MKLLAAGLAAARLIRGQTNIIKMLWKFNSLYNLDLQIADHQQPVQYEISLPPAPLDRVDRQSMYIHAARGRSGRQIDNSTEKFVDETGMGPQTREIGRHSDGQSHNVSIALGSGQR